MSGSFNVSESGVSQSSPFSSPSVPSSAQHLRTMSSASAVAPSPLTSSQVSGTVSSTPSNLRDTNPVILCRMGQETLMEIVQKTTEIFNYIRTLQLPNGMNMTMQQFTDRKTKLEEPLRRVEVLFTKLREIYDAVIEVSATVELVPVEELLPLEDCISQSDLCMDEQPGNFSNDERLLIEQIRVKNRQLKEIIDLQRMIIWEINTMMSTRRSTGADK